MPQTFVKDPDAIKAFAVDWTDWLNEVSPQDTISTSTWTAESGITIDGNTNNTKTAWVTLSGGVAGVTYNVTNEITTANGSTDQRTIKIIVREQ